MKNTLKIIAVAVVGFVLSTNFAGAYVQVVPGYGDGLGCQQSGSCDNNQTIQIRLNTLEKAVIELQNENTALRAQVAGQVNVGSQSNNSSLEARVSLLEKGFSVLADQVLKALGIIISKLTK